LSNLCGIQSSADKLPQSSAKTEKVGFAPIYASDDMSRLSVSLQATPLMRLQSAVTINSGMASECNLLGSEQVQVKQGKGTAVLPLRVDDGVADGCVYVPVGIGAVSHLGGAYGNVSLEKIS
jgi:NADH-quinone oxidoreductase subunit G